VKISIVLTTYNRIDALVCVLESLNNQQTYNFEVVIADDGSNAETKKAIINFKKKSKFEIMHVWHEDIGFRAASIRNKAVAFSKGEYLIFLDGDCIAFPSFIARHIHLAEYGYFVRGSRVMLSELFTQELIQSGLPVSSLSISNIIRLRLLRKIKRIVPLIKLPLGNLRKQKEKKWHGVKTCNLGVWRKDFLAVNGFDEQYIGWGHEDADLTVRLINNKVYRKEGVNAVTVMHLWHSLNDRSHIEENERRLKDRLNSNATYIKNGVSQYL